MNPEEKRNLIEEHPRISKTRQAELLGIPRSTFYYRPKENPEDEILKEKILEIHNDYIFYGARRIRQEMKRSGYRIGLKRTRGLMREMNIRTVYPKPKTSIPDKQHKKYPYLLRGRTIGRINEVWSTDITYIRVKGGWIYLTAIIDWYSRYVISWEISITMDNGFCIRALESALKQGQPEIFNSDQGAQYTSKDFTKILEERKIKISMDGKGRCLDNIFCERLWRSVKYEDMYLKDYETVFEAYCDLKKYFEFYNHKRPHQSLDYRTPAEVYFQKTNTQK